MSTILSKKAFELICGLKTVTAENNLVSSHPVKKDYNYEITVQRDSEKCKILVFFGKKGIKTILQGNEHSGLYRLLESIVFNKLPVPAVENEADEPQEYIGTDESGKGDIFGPLVVAAAYVDKKTSQKLLKIGVRDSKEIKNGKIQSLAGKIKDIIGDKYTIIDFPPVKYNSIYNQFLNLNKLLDYAHSQAIEKLLLKVNCSTIITDQFSKNALSISKNKLFAHKEFIQLPKAEKFIGVAAASILAREHFEAWFIEQESCGFHLQKGASLEVERNAKEILNSFDKETLLRLTKSHFKPVKNLLSIQKS